MMMYLIKRMIYAIPILIGVNVITFALFFMVNSPNDMARMHLGEKYVTPAAIAHWKQQHGYDKPLFYDTKASGVAALTQTLFFKKSLGLFSFDFGRSNQGRSIAHDIAARMWPSLALAIPSLILGLLVNITFALLMVLFRATVIDFSAVIFCVVLMSISGLFYIIVGQYLFGEMLKLVPVSGYHHGIDAIKFLILPVAIGVISGMGAGGRWYRAIFLEEIHKDYVRAARAKGLSEWQVLYRHVLKNAMLPIITGVVVIIPMLFMGSLIMESFFGIPGLGSYTIDAIAHQDFNIVRVMVFIGTLFYILGLIMTDVCYAIVDPRIRLA